MSDPGDRTLMSDGSLGDASDAPGDLSRSAGPPLAGHDARPREPTDRYVDLGPIGRGGMGEVRRVRDTRLGCVVARKCLGAALIDSAVARARFLAEARLTARLSHPGIPAVHDIGALPDGRPFFTLTEIRGRDLAAVLKAGETPLRRLVEVVSRVCDVMAYAHSKGVIHRDLKPANVMVGPFGEVYVMDWGLGRSVGAAEPAPDRESDAAGAAGLTRHGQTLGTRGYMPPEQAHGASAALGPTADVYAVGAMLYHVLAGRPPHDSGPWRPADFADLAAPPSLLAVCRDAMHADPARRFAACDRMRDALHAWLDGARRKAQAEAEMDRADAREPTIERLRAEAEALREAAERALAELPPWAPPEAKAPHWRAEDEAAARLVEAEVAEVRWLRTIRAALDVHPGLPRATEALIAHYRARLLAAERARDDRAAARYAALLRPLDRGALGGFLRGEGTLHLAADADGTATVQRFEPQGRRLVLGDARPLGPLPIDATLPRGSYLITVDAPGQAPARVPVLVERGARWTNTPPGAEQPAPLRLLPADALGPDDAHVPAGWFLSGGDAEADEPLPARRLWVDAFVIERFPVTFARYLAFLDALHGAGRAEEAAARAPRRPRGGRGDVRTILVGGRHRLDPDDDRPVALDWPVTGVSWHDAVAFARWRAAETGLPWRLPNELEWEKAARGVDGRFCAWGDLPEPTWGRMLGSTESAPSPVPVDAYPIDVSVYGVRGVTGNVRDWCANVWSYAGPKTVDGRVLADVAADDDPELRVLRGGCWSTAPVHCRLAGRTVNRPDGRFASLGFRLLRPL